MESTHVQHANINFLTEKKTYMHAKKPLSNFFIIEYSSTIPCRIANNLKMMVAILFSANPIVSDRYTAKQYLFSTYQLVKLHAQTPVKFLPVAYRSTISHRIVTKLT